MREKRKAQGKAEKHKQLMKAVSGAARSKKSQKRIAHRARMLQKDAEAEAAGADAGAAEQIQRGGDATMAEIGKAVAAGAKKGRARKRKAGKGKGGVGAAAAAGADGMQE